MFIDKLLFSGAMNSTDPLAMFQYFISASWVASKEEPGNLDIHDEEPL